MRLTHAFLAAAALLGAVPARAEQQTPPQPDPASTVATAPTGAPATPSAGGADAGKNNQPIGPLTARASYQLRIDANSIQVNQGGNVTDTTQFTDYLVRMAVAGDIGPGVTYLIRYDVRNTFLTTPAFNGTDGVIGALERAYIQQELTPWLTVRYGRQPMTALSIEGDYSSLDLYGWSKLYEQIFWNAMGSADGIGVAVTVGEQTLIAQAFDGPQDQDGSQTANGTQNGNLGTQKGENMTYAFGWRGRLFGDHVKPILTYDWYNRVRNGHGASRDDKAVFTSSGIGAVFSAFHTDLEAEWDTYRKPAFTSHTWDSAGNATAVANPTDDWSTYVVQLAHNIEHPNLRAFVKGSLDRETYGSTDVYYKHGQVGVEYRPFNGPFRYHFVILDADDESLPKGGVIAPEKKTLQYLVGVASRG